MEEETKKSKINYDFIKKLLGNKKERIITLSVVAIIVLCVGIFLTFNKKTIKIALNQIYDVYPEEVRKLYSNLVNVGCEGDMFYDIAIDQGIVKVEDLKEKELVAYIFSYMDKNEMLSDSFKTSLFHSVESLLYDAKLNLLSSNKTYDYGDYTYTIKGDKVTRKKRECKADKKTILHLYGYFWNEEILSMDVNVAYLKDGILYNYDNQNLGAYDGDASKLSSLTENTSYFRFNYGKDGDNFKLLSVEWKHRS